MGRLKNSKMKIWSLVSSQNKTHVGFNRTKEYSFKRATGTPLVVRG